MKKEKKEAKKLKEGDEVIFVSVMFYDLSNNNLCYVSVLGQCGGHICGVIVF